MRVVWVALALGLVSCGGKTTRPTMGNDEADEQKKWESTLLRRVAVPRPSLDVELLIPDFHEELRWPLTAMSHPELAPQFEIASVFADPGIGWLELCERGVQNRVQSGRNRDELEYLRGWCSAIKGDADSACGKLMPLTTSAVLGMSAAVRIDVANIIASTGDIDKADKILNKHKIRDVDIYDTLAATYVELGMENAAHEMNRRAIELNPTALKASTLCRRLVKDIVLGGESGQPILIEQLKDMATKPKLPDETCERLYREAMCFIGPGSNCYDYFKAENIDTRNTFLIDAYRAWPTIPATYYEWLDVVNNASLAEDLAGAPELTNLALDAAIAASPECSKYTLETIARLAKPATPKAPLTERQKQLQAELDRCKWTDAPPPKPTAVATGLPARTPDCGVTLIDDSDGCRAQFCGDNPGAADCQPPQPPVPAQTCDPGPHKRKAADHTQQGKYTEALKEVEAALVCIDENNLRQLAFMLSCQSGNSSMAKHYYRRIPQAAQKTLASVCTGTRTDYQ